MFIKELQATAQALVADRKGLLAADETVSILFIFRGQRCMCSSDE